MNSISNPVTRTVVAVQARLRDPDGPMARFRSEEGLVSAELVGFVVIGLIFLTAIVTLQTGAANALGQRIQTAIAGLGAN